VKARTANINVSVVKVTLPRPQVCSKWAKQCGIDRLEMNVVVVEETGATKGVKPVRWILMTSLPVNTFNDAWQVIEDYEDRWMVENCQARYAGRHPLYLLSA